MFLEKSSNHPSVSSFLVNPSSQTNGELKTIATLSYLSILAYIAFSTTYTIKVFLGFVIFPAPLAVCSFYPLEEA